jgi:hypothetical protein
MKKILFAMTAVTALCAAMPAAAQYRGGYANDYRTDTWFEARIDALEGRIDAGVRNGRINRREAGNLRRELAGVDLMEDRLAINGLNRVERDQLQRRLRLIRDRIRVADGGSYDRYDRWADFDDSENRFYGRGGPYEEATVVCERRGGLISRLIDDRDCFVVGERVTFDLDPVPYSYRRMYRDRDGTYFRWDGRRVYEIDADTNTVVRVHRVPRD